MGWWARILGVEQRSGTSTLDAPSQELLEALLGPTTAAGVPMTTALAAALPDPFSCMQVLSQDLARTPLKFQAVSPDGNRQDAVTHRLWEILHDLANPETTSFDFRYEMMWDLLQHEQAYAEIQRSRYGDVVGLWRLDATKMRVDRDARGQKRWRYRLASGGEQTWVFNPSTPPIFEVRMRSPLRRLREAFGLTAALEQYGGKFFANGARLSGMFTVPPNAGPDAYEKFKAQVKSLFTSSANSHKALTTRGDVKYTPFTSQNNEAQFLESRKYQRSVAAGAFRVPPHKIGDLDRATFSNIEHQEIEYVNGALGPYYEVWQQALRRDVLTTRQYPRYDVVFDRSALIQGDLASMADALSKLVNGGIASINDARRRLSWNTIPPAVGDEHFLNSTLIKAKSAGDVAPDPVSGGDPGVEPEQVM